MQVALAAGAVGEQQLPVLCKEQGGVAVAAEGVVLDDLGRAPAHGLIPAYGVHQRRAAAAARHDLAPEIIGDRVPHGVQRAVCRIAGDLEGTRRGGEHGGEGRRPVFAPVVGVRAVLAQLVCARIQEQAVFQLDHARFLKSRVRILKGRIDEVAGLMPAFAVVVRDQDDGDALPVGERALAVHKAAAVVGQRHEQPSVSQPFDAVIVDNVVGPTLLDRAGHVAVKAFALVHRAAQHHRARAVVFLDQEKHAQIAVLHAHQRHAHDVAHAEFAGPNQRKALRPAFALVT